MTFSRNVLSLQRTYFHDECALWFLPFPKKWHISCFNMCWICLYFTGRSRPSTKIATFHDKTWFCTWLNYIVICPLYFQPFFSADDIVRRIGFQLKCYHNLYWQPQPMDLHIILLTRCVGVFHRCFQTLLHHVRRSK